MSKLENFSLTEKKEDSELLIVAQSLTEILAKHNINVEGFYKNEDKSFTVELNEQLNDDQKNDVKKLVADYCSDEVELNGLYIDVQTKFLNAEDTEMPAGFEVTDDMRDKQFIRLSIHKNENTN